MPLIPCPDCGQFVRRAACTCPFCGVKVAECARKHTAAAVLLGLAVACSDDKGSDGASSYSMNVDYGGGDMDTDTDTDSDTDSGGSGHAGGSGQHTGGTGLSTTSS